MSERPQLLYCQDILDSGAAISNEARREQGYGRK